MDRHWRYSQLFDFPAKLLGTNDLAYFVLPSVTKKKFAIGFVKLDISEMLSRAADPSNEQKTSEDKLRNI